MSSNSKSISVIVQKDNQPPRHYWFYPGTLKKVLISFSFIFTLVSSIAIGLSLFYVGDYFTFLSTKETLEKKISNLELRLSDQKNSWSIERERLENLALSKPGNGMSNLQLIKTLPMAKDLSSQSLVEVDNVKVEIDDKKIEVNFHLSNQSEQSRISGRLFTIFKNGNKQLIYPLPKDIQNIKFNEGEFFSIARFRKSKIPFNGISINDEILKSASLNVIIFSLEGDLLFEKHLAIKEVLGKR